MQVSKYQKNIIGNGVLATSHFSFYSPTDFAKTALYYIDRIGDYQCDDSYIVERECLDAYLIFVITEGKLYFSYRNRTFTAPAGSIVFLDCNIPHKYYAKESVSFKWFHFNGCGSKQYSELLLSIGEPLFFPNNFADINIEVQQLFQSIADNNINEHQISYTIHRILADLALIYQDKNSTCEQIISEVAEYINCNFYKNLSVDHLASKCHLSTYYFIRLFNRVHNCTPHKYIINIRLNYAKRLLLTTDMPIANISDTCGFSTPSNFIKTFKTNHGYTPGQFRKLRDPNLLNASII